MSEGWVVRDEISIEGARGIVVFVSLGVLEVENLNILT